MKIAYIGGGSVYAPGVIRAFANLGDIFHGGEIALMDIDAPNLDVVRRLGARMAQAQGVELNITATTDRREALQGADFVLTSFRAGGFQARALDERIPLKYGVIGQETVGPGGFFFALRNLVVIKELCDEIEELCPNTWLVNYANPTNIIGEAVTRFSQVKTLALCDGGKHDAYHAASVLGFPEGEVEFYGLGLNHATWSTRFTIAGRDGAEMMTRSLDKVLGDPNVASGTKRMFRLAARYGRLPNHYMQYYYFPEDTLAEATSAPRTRAQVIIAELPGIFDHYREQAEAEQPTLTKARGGTGFGEFAVDVIAAIATNSGRVEMLNVPNRGTCSIFPPERVAEVPCRLDSAGATPLAYGEIPQEMSGLLGALADYQALAAQVGWHGGDRNTAIKALASNPLVWKLDANRIEELYNEMAVAHAEWLPEGLR